jgi:hypothetical protein
MTRCRSIRGFGRALPALVFPIVLLLPSCGNDGPEFKFTPPTTTARPSPTVEVDCRGVVLYKRKDSEQRQEGLRRGSALTRA